MLRLFLAFALALGCAAPVRAEPLDPTPRIAVMSAFFPEWQALLATAEDAEVHAIDGKRFVTARLGGKNVVLLMSGIGMVNAAMSAQQALDRFRVTAIVFSGIAGGIDPTRNIGDVVVAEQWAEYLESVFARETPRGYAPPAFIPTPHPNFGMIHPIDTEVGRDLAPETRFWFPAAPALLTVARRVAGKVTLGDCAAGACLAAKPQVLVGGNGVSGSAFVDNAAFRDYVFASFRAEVVDKESAAVAHVAYANGAPFIAFRSLSDLAGGGAHANEMDTFMALAAENSVKVVTAFLREMPNP